MYIQLTTKCNMSCKHCCFGCTARGRDISVENAKKAINLAKDYGDTIILGGGEPTLHPNFEEILFFAIIASDSDNKPHITTNGKLTERALIIAKLTKNNVIYGDLSQDEFHDPIDPIVIQAFKDIPSVNDDSWVGSWVKSYKGRIRDVTFGGTREPIVIAGREITRRGLTEAPKNPSATEEICPCDEVFVRPSGKIYQCGCKKSPCIGDVDLGYLIIGDGCYQGEYCKKDAA